MVVNSVGNLDVVSKLSKWLVGKSLFDLSTDTSEFITYYFTIILLGSNNPKSCQIYARCISLSALFSFIRFHNVFDTTINLTRFRRGKRGDAY